MKKILLLVIVTLIMPNIVLANCDSKEHENYVNYTTNITYDNDFSKSSKQFTITLYNVISDVYVMYNDEKYVSDSNDTILIDGISQGSTVKLNIYTNDGCNESVKTIRINEPYYNTFLEEKICSDYINKISYCTAQFVSTKPTEDLVNIAIQNYKHNIVQDKEDVVVVEDKLTIDEILEFLTNWGVKALLLFVTCLLSISWYNNKYIKVKHGL